MKRVAIIGGGLGGLCAGALLAKDGYDVTLLEQHNIVGGCATTFRRKGGFVCEVGLHEMDGVYTNQMVKKAFETLGVYQNIEFVKPKEFFKVNTAEGDFIMPDGVDEAKYALKKRFPSEANAIDKYFETISILSDKMIKMGDMRWYHYLIFPFLFAEVLKYKDKSVSDVLDLLTDDEELKLILNTNVQYYGDSPDTLSFLLHAIAQNSYYKGGGYFIKGGSYNLSKYLSDVIEQNNGTVITSANVIKATKNQLIYEKKGRQAIVDADIIVSNISPFDTYKLFDIGYLEKKKISKSITTLYIGFSKNLKSVYGTGAYSNFMLEELSSCADFGVKKSFVFVDYSQIDSGLVDDSKSFGEVCIIDELSKWDGLGDDEYEIAKDRLAEDVFATLEKHYPKIKEYVEFVEVATPKTMERYIKTPMGTAYGYEPTPKQFFRPLKSKSKKLDNLYFVGQFAVSGGFSAAIMSGYICRKEISGLG